MKPQRKITSSEKKLFVLTGFVLTFIIGFGAWWQYANAVPNVEIPTPKMPSPNAYDFYIKAIAARVPPNTPVDPVHDAKNIPKAQWKTVYPTAQKEAWLQANSKSLNLLRQGFKYPCRVPPQRSATSSATRSPSMAGFREMARTLIIESHARSERGDWGKASECALDILHFGQDISQGGNVMDCLMGAAINGIGRKELWNILPHLNTKESKATARRLERILKSRPSYADVLREEKYYSQAVLLEWMRTPNSRPISGKHTDPLESVAAFWANIKLTRRAVFNNHAEMMDALIAAAEKPYNTKTKLPEPPDDIFSKMLMPVYSRSRWNYARNESGNALLLVALALRAYELEHKTYPQNLQQLVPNYLQKIPADPYGGGEALRYKRAGREYSLYSIGPDGVDNRGRAIEDMKVPKTQKSKRFLLRPESKGDIVAGVN